MSQKLLMDEAIRQAIDQIRFSSYEIAQINKILKQVQDDIIASLASIDPLSPIRLTYQKQRLLKFQEQYRALLDKAYNQVNGVVRKDLQIMIIQETKGATQAMNAALGIDLFSITLSNRKLKAIVTNTLIDGKLIGDWWKSQNASTKDKLDRLMRQATTSLQVGRTKGEALGQMIQRIRGTRTQAGILDVSRREAASLVRTSISQVSNEGMKMMYEENLDVIKEYKWSSTLDLRTTPICRALDTKRYSVNYEPIGHSIRYPGNPAHWQCRSLLLPQTKSWDELVKTQEGETLRQLEEMSLSERAALGQPVKGGTSYSQWLTSQSKSVQMDVLGPSRWKLWNDGKLPLSKMVNQDGRYLTLAELGTRRETRISALKG